MNDDMISVPEAVFRYRNMERFAKGSSMIREVRWQYADMANGGDGGGLELEDAIGSNCREYNYSGAPDSFFQEVCDLLGWKW